MKKSKKWCFIGIGLVMAIGIIFAVTIKKENRVEITERNKTSVVLPILIGGGDASWETCMNEVAAEYMEEHPKVEVRVRTVANIENMDYDKAIVIEEALGNFDGIVEMRNVEKYIEQRKVLSLPSEVTEPMKQVRQVEGKIYSIPRYYSSRGIIYNKKIFEELEITVPKSYDEFLEICQKLKAKNITPLTVGAGDLWHLDHWCSILFSINVNQKNPDWLKLCNEGKVHWTDVEPKQMLKDFRNLFEKGFVEESYENTTDADTIEMLTEGRTAMLCSGTWMFSQIKKVDPQFEIGWFFFPNHQGEALVELNGDWEWAITSSCREMGIYDTAIDFLKFYYSDEVYEKVLQNMNGLSALKENISYEALPVQEEIAKVVGAEGSVENASVESVYTPEGFVNTLYYEMLKLAKGEQTVTETAEKLEEEWRVRLEKER